MSNKHTGYIGLEFPDGSNLPAMLETQEACFNPWVRKIPWRRKMATHFSENPMNQGVFVGYSLSQELDMTEQFFMHKLIIYSCGPYMK